jgi:hypothetical protein
MGYSSAFRGSARLLCCLSVTQHEDHAVSARSFDSEHPVPGFVTQLECEDEAPSVAEETLRTVAKYLRLDPDELLVLANRTPRDVRPESPLEVTLYRKVKKLSESDQERVRLYMERIIRERGGR